MQYTLDRTLSFGVLAPVALILLALGMLLQAAPVSASGLDACLAAPNSEQDPIAAPTQSGDELDQWLATTASRLETAAREVAPEDAYEPLAVLDIAGFEPQALRNWVAEHTAYIPYSGILRGPQGVLIERRGNSLDRALLLAELVTATGSDARLARGPAMAIESRPVVPPQADNSVIGVSLLPSNQRAAALAGLARRADCDTATRARIDQQTAALLQLVGKPTATPATKPPSHQANRRTSRPRRRLLVGAGQRWRDLVRPLS